MEIIKCVTNDLFYTKVVYIFYLFKKLDNVIEKKNKNEKGVKGEKDDKKKKEKKKTVVVTTCHLMSTLASIK